LKSNPGRLVLSAAAKSLCPYFSRYPQAVGFLNPVELSGEPRENIVATIEAELVVFLHSKTAPFQKRVTAGEGNTIAYLRSAFINHCKDKSRNPDQDRYRYYYKRVADVLRRSDIFQTKNIRAGRQKIGMEYFEEIGSKPARFFTPEDYDLVPYPDQFGSLRTFEDIKTNQVILRLTRYFLNEVTSLWGEKPVRIQLKDFIHWLSLYVDLTNPKIISDPDGGENRPDSRFRPDRMYEHDFFDTKQVVAWAGMFSRALRDKDAAILYLYHEKKYTFERIAVETGYQGASGPSQRLAGIEERLRFFIRDLPWISPDDSGHLNEDAFEQFRAALMQFLKKRVPAS